MTTSSDVYGLGAILYALLTGRAPFGGESIDGTLEQVRSASPSPPSKINPCAPRDLEVICLKCLEKNPSRRYASAQALAEDLGRHLAGEPMTARPTGARAGWLWCRRNPWLAGAIGSTAAGLVAVAALSLLYADRQGQIARQSSQLAQQQTHIADQQTLIATEQADSARKQAESTEKVTRLAGDLKSSLKESAQRLASLEFERSEVEFGKQQIGRGMLRLVQSWRAAVQADDAGWQHTARASLSAWTRYHRPVRALFSESVLVAFSPDGRTVVICQNGAARLWDLTTGKPIGRPFQQSRVNAVAFSPDGRKVLTGGRDAARLWDAADGSPIGTPMIHGFHLRPVAFSPDGKIMLTWRNSVDIGKGKLARIESFGEARLWDAVTTKPFGSPMSHNEGHSVTFSPDGRRVLTKGDNEARLWDASTGRPIGTMVDLEHSFDPMVFTPDGQTVLICSGMVVRRWDATNAKEIGSPIRLAGKGELVQFSPDGLSVLARADQGERASFQIWNVTAGKPIGARMEVESCDHQEFSSDGRFVLTLSQGDQKARLWDAATGQPSGLPMEIGENAYNASFSPDGRLVSTFGETTRLWQVDACEPIGMPLDGEGPHRSWGSEPNKPPNVGFSRDSSTVMIRVGTEDSWGRWSATTGEQLGTAFILEPVVLASMFRADGRAVFFGGSWLWDRSSVREIGHIGQQRHWDVAAISPDGRVLLTGSPDNVVRLWNAETGLPIGHPLEHGPRELNGGTAIAFSRDSRTVITGGGDSTARLWDASTGKPLGTPLEHGNVVTSVAFSPRGRTVLTGCSDGKAQLRDRATCRPLGLPLEHAKSVLAVAFSPDDGNLLTACADGKARLWEATTGRPVGTPIAHTDAVTALCFSPDGNRILTGSADGSARLWEAATSKPVGKPMMHNPAVTIVCFSPDGGTILTCADEETARLWDAATGESLEMSLPEWGINAPDYRFKVKPLTPEEAGDDLEFSPDGLTTVTETATRVTLRDSSTAKPLGPPLHPGGSMKSADPTTCMFSADRRTLLTAGGGVGRLRDVTLLPDNLPQIATWIEVITGLWLDEHGEIQSLDQTGWQARLKRLEILGGVPTAGPRWSLDPILFGPNPTSRAQSFVESELWEDAEKAFDEAVGAGHTTPPS